MDRAVIGKQALSAFGVAALMLCPVAFRGQTAPAVAQPEVSTYAHTVAAQARAEQDAMILARQGLMEGIYQYVEDAEDWTDQSPSTGDTAMLQALTREAAHMALMLPAFKQLFPPSTNPESPEFSSAFDTYALPAIWAEAELFSDKLNAMVAAINVLAMARDRAEYTQRLQGLQTTCDVCHDRFRRVYVSPFDAK